MNLTQDLTRAVGEIPNQLIKIRKTVLVLLLAGGLGGLITLVFW